MDVPAKSELGGQELDVNPYCSLGILAGRAHIDDKSITQSKNAARALPGIIHADALPDLRPGTKYLIGAVFVSKGWIHPPLIGRDIGCSMTWSMTTLTQS